MKRERGLISDCTYNSDKRERERERREWGKHTQHTHKEHAVGG